jgi:hypothetical protein
MTDCLGKYFRLVNVDICIRWRCICRCSTASTCLRRTDVENTVQTKCLALDKNRAAQILNAPGQVEHSKSAITSAAVSLQCETATLLIHWVRRNSNRDIASVVSAVQVSRN